MGWAPNGAPCFASGTAPSFLWMEKQLREHGLRPATGVADAFVQSQHGPAALYLITTCVLENPDAWPPLRPADDAPAASTPPR